MEQFLIQGLKLILPVCNGTSRLSQRAALAARWLHEPQMISNRAVGVEFPHRGERYQLG